ncbi:hypothetical protein LCGC14_0464600 [marine sediment metagenome]|uniref:Acetyltransferase n=1 Tax=marine sediment metagenome TaxID=412755 RepID=A0A0F9VMT3_9ZZZZ
MNSLKKIATSYYLKYFFTNSYKRAEEIKRMKYLKSQGEECYIAGSVGFAEPDKISIGNRVWLTVGVKVIAHDASDVPFGGKVISSPVVIGNKVFVGTNAIILKGVTIGDNVIIGAGAVVAKDIPSNSIVIGNPIRIIKRKVRT